MKRRYLIVLVLVFALGSLGRSGHAQPSTCGMQLATGPLAFCETFDAPAGVGNRSGQLNGVLWGVSRLGGQDSPAQVQIDEWVGPEAIDVAPGVEQPAQPDSSDIVILNGQMREVSNDGGQVTTLSMYPRQPFDFAGRTGTIAFDVTNDTFDSHSYWPELWISDQPVPAPFTHGGPPCSFCSLPLNGVGIRFDAEGGDCPGGWRAGEVIVVRNSIPETAAIFDFNTTGVEIHETGCASLATGPDGILNHIEVQISQNQIDIYASPGTPLYTGGVGPSALTHINSITNANLTFSRGLVWISDVHYNAEKANPPGLDALQNHTFTWDNVAFDGPLLPRDLGFDVMDSLTVSPAPITPALVNGLNLGYAINATPITLTTLPMTAAQIAAASNQLLLLDWDSTGTSNVTNFTYTVNGHVHANVPVPVLPAEYQFRNTAAFPIAATDVVPGAQTITIVADQPVVVANVDIVLAGAGGLVAPGGGTSPQFPTRPSNLRIVSFLFQLFGHPKI